MALAAGRSPLAALAAAPLELAGPTLQAGAGQPAIVARGVWARGICRPRVAPEYGAVRVAFVHHTENPNGYLAREVPAMLRAIFAFHLQRSWLERHWLQLPRSMPSGASSRRAQAASTSRSSARRPAATTCLHRHRRARLLRRPADLRAGQTFAAAAARLEARVARRAGTGTRHRARQPCRRRLQPLSGQRAGVASAHRRSPRRRHDRLSRRCALSPAADDSPTRPQPCTAAGARDARAYARPDPGPRAGRAAGIAGASCERRSGRAHSPSSTTRRSPARPCRYRRAASRAVAKRSSSRRSPMINATQRGAGRCRRASRPAPATCRCVRSTPARLRAPVGRPRAPAQPSLCRSRSPLRRSRALQAPAPTPAAAGARAQ